MREKSERLKKSASCSKTIDVLFSKAKKNQTTEQPSVEPDIQNIENDFSNIDDV